MSEILEFPTEKRLTAESRFLLAADRQASEPQDGRTTTTETQSQRPTGGQIKRAKQELALIFSADNVQDADKLYRQGLHDVVNSPRRKVAWFAIKDSSGVEMYHPRYTEAAQFYIHVETLTSIAAHEFDHPKP